MTYDAWVDELASCLGATGVLELSAHGYRKLRDRLAAQLHDAEAAAVLRTVAQADVAAAALQREQRMLDRRRAMVGGSWAPEHRATRERWVREGLAHRDHVEALQLLTTEALAPVLAEPPGGREAWPGFWTSDRGRDRHRHTRAA